MVDDPNKSSSSLTKTFLADRDLKIFQRRRQGVPASTIASEFRISTSSVNAACQRMLTKMNTEALLAYPEALRLELERLDDIQAGIWTMAHHRTITTPTGDQIALEPDLKAVSQLLQVIALRSKLMGLDRLVPQDQGIQGTGIQVVDNIRSSIHGATEDQTNVHDPRSEAIQLAKMMGETGVLDDDLVKQMIAKIERGEELPALEAPKEDTIEDAEIVEEDNAENN